MPYGERVVWQTVHTRVRKSPWEITERFTRKMPESSELGGMAQSVEHIVHIDGVVGSSPTVTTRAEAVENQRLLLLCLHPGVHCPGVVFVGVNGSDNPNCQDFGYGFL